MPGKDRIKKIMGNNMIIQYLSNLDVRITVESRIPLLLRSE